MKRRELIIFFIILLIPLVFAECSENQININSASKEDLDKLDGIGPVKADAIINSRPFDSVNDLINVSGIGEITLSKIKVQGLACVENEKINETENREGQNETRGNEENNTKKYTGTIQNPEPEEIEIIKLSLPKDIKTNNNSSNQGKIAIYGLLLFCILLIILFTIKIFKRKDGIC